MSIKIIAAIGTRGLLGLEENGKHHLPWRIPEDMRHFTSTTMDHVVIMGRSTWESLPAPFQPLPDRTNLVLSSNQDYQADGAQVFTSLEDALAFARGVSEKPIFIMGGARVYEEALPRAEELILTRVDEDTIGDVSENARRILFPEYEHLFVPKELRGFQVSEKGPRFQFEVWERKA